ncbi:uncharacterized protein SOCG_05284 [Schizosaccharomyces octosporus yFS286]|uniref:Uncharacterized protein n=1 Tax=Schizosaccharomyces octosporus (strain yFS286) TaxID=483514 RepID=S9Q485_SCHOY|nr:uncharacterized protein SOCG_05284 [Schizosaccharomyces octosporus yFS286]EPX74912.1 hypothetical protein SOCG_05284 [Schizosaccharomyces octosporus yFS286]
MIYSFRGITHPNCFYHECRSYSIYRKIIASFPFSESTVMLRFFVLSFSSSFFVCKHKTPIHSLPYLMTPVEKPSPKSSTLKKTQELVPLMLMNPIRILYVAVVHSCSCS